MFYVTSDIHLEFHPNINDITSKILKEISECPLAERVLYLCGDIGHPFAQSYSEFLDFCSDNFKYVLVIAGNHEYYNICGKYHTMSEIDSQMDKLVKKYPNVYNLNNSYCILPEFRTIVVGSTLWSELDEKNHHKGINDFNNIVTDESKKTNSNLTLLEYNQLHKKDLEGLINKIDEIAELRHNDPLDDYIFVVMTHHLPSYKLIAPQYTGSLINHFFATDLDSTIKKLNDNSYSCISHWFCGHTHTRMTTDIYGTTVIVNPYGYPHEYDQKDRKVLKQVSLSECE